ncbi:MAG: hypothetical protein KAH86_06295, partial [Methanosarcinales archaeon]|nr:hypothetical protein [Methanosarcinales archaeon]
MTRRRLLYNRSLCSRLLLLVLIVATICAAGAGVGMSADITVTSFNTTLSNNTPANGTSILAPTISINATNTVSGINASSAKMTVEGVQVTLTSTGSGPIFKFINTSTSTYAHGDTVNVAFNVSNNAGDMTNTSWMFYIDNVNPTISITSPGDGYPTTASSINISGIANGTGSPPNVTVNGTSIPFTPGFNITFEANVSLSLGTNIIYANITDAAGNTNSTTITIMRNPESGAGSDIITVGGGGSGADYTSIQAAIDNATAGATISVQNGTYYENVNVYKRLTIRSASGDPADTIVQAVSS